MSISESEHDLTPSDVLDAGETIASATWTITNKTNPTEETASMVSGNADLSGKPIIRQKIVGGTDGNQYLHRCIIVTNSGRTLVQGVGQIVETGA